MIKNTFICPHILLLQFVNIYLFSIPPDSFNHAGRGFGPFVDVCRNRENSKYLNWFHIDLNGNSNYNDGLWYEGWEGNYDLVKLNLQNNEVVEYLLDAVTFFTTIVNTWYSRHSKH